ncbi:sensor histidine kinase [Candidatus Gracilibacteria bacterium]|nr:MAG: sensor histidine kinase [Candidatus Gracilibacteria bacterium]
MNLEKDLEKIKELLKDVKYLTLDQITSFLDWSPKKKKDNKTIILSWIDSGDLIMDKKHRLSLPENSGYVKGVFRIIKNKFAFVDKEDSEEKEGIFIPKDEFNNALDGDTVLVEITEKKKSDKGAEGRVVKIIEHRKNTVVAPLFIAFVAFVGYKIVKNAFKPVKKISETALEIKKSKNFSRRIELDHSEDEIHKMASTFNEMLDTVEEVFIHEKQFSSDVSHELRTPITVILAQSDYALDYVETLDEAKESFEVINRQAKKMTNLINQIMELSKMERQSEIEKEKINFSNIILQLLEDYKNLLENNNIELITNVEKDLRIYGNRLMLERLFINLFTNAMKFTKSTINVSLNRINKEVILQIKDDGVGIAKKDQKYIWDRFFQTSDSRNKDKNKGSGLGLSMVNRIVQLHSATIEVESEVGEGACFIVKFPI